MEIAAACEQREAWFSDELQQIVAVPDGRRARLRSSHLFDAKHCVVDTTAVWSSALSLAAIK
jgi:hypothetical protein